VSTSRFYIYRKDGHVQTAYDAHDLVTGIARAKRLAAENGRTYVVTYPSAAPIVTVTPSGAIHWN
jgi:hypothetical protein